MSEGFSALDAALSFYNDGNSKDGFFKGYIANVCSCFSPLTVLLISSMLAVFVIPRKSFERSS
jgi:hypothetical protein